MLKAGVAGSSIGVISPYEAQKNRLIQVLSKTSEACDVQIGDVDAFQGEEKDVIFLSMVRSNKRSQIGFLKDPRRLNVAVTRAKFVLAIMGNASTLMEGDKEGSLTSLLRHCDSTGCFLNEQLRPKALSELVTSRASAAACSPKCPMQTKSR